MKPLEGYLFTTAILVIVVVLLYCVPTEQRPGELCWLRDVVYPWEAQTTQTYACIPYTSYVKPKPR